MTPPRSDAESGAAVVVTCEHAGNVVPPPYRQLFAHGKTILHSHRGWDPGAFGAALAVSEGLHAPLHFSRVTRLLVDLNRSIGSPTIFSEFVDSLDEDARQTILETHYHPHRRAVETTLRGQIAERGCVTHIGVHSFVDAMGESARDFEIGLLFDPARDRERTTCEEWTAALASHAPTVGVRLNAPYLGIDDGLTTHLRTVFPDAVYSGIEVELRQGWIGSTRQQAYAAELLAATFPRQT